MMELKSAIKFSNGLEFNISKKKAHQVILTDKNGTVVLDAKNYLKGNTADFEITISDNLINR